MKKILKIAKLELSVLFYSPVAWLVLVIFMVQCSMHFFSLYQSMQEGLSAGISINNLTYSVFPDQPGLFEDVLQNLYLYIPLLTMGLMSRETSSGSIKLLLSSPVKIREIILGKYLAMVGYGFLLIIILAIYSVIAIFTIKDADTGLIISGLIGLFLLTCTYAAIGLFMSSLTSYQVVAAISTLAVFAVLRFVGSVGQEINFLRDLTYFLSISGRADDMLKGLISTKDVLYFILIILLFLSLCIMRLQNGRKRSSLMVQTGKYTAIAGVILMLGYISSRAALTGYLDMTATKKRTLTRETQAIARQVDGALKITTYVNLLDDNIYFGLPAARNTDLQRFEQFRRFIPGLIFDYIYYYDDPVKEDYVPGMSSYQLDLNGLNTQQKAEKIAENMGLDIDMFMPPSAIHKIADLTQENNNIVRTVEYKGRKSVLRLYNGFDQFPSEREIAAAIKRLLMPAPKVAFITGDNERSITKKGDRNYHMMAVMKRNRIALINQGFDVIDLNLHTQEIPDSLSVLILGDPAIEPDSVEMKKITAYLDKGGNMFIAGEPGRQQLLNPLLRLMDIQMKEGILVTPSKDDAPDLMYGQLTQGDAVIAMPGAAALEYMDHGRFAVDTQVVSAATGWNKSGKVDLSAALSYQPGDQKGVFPIILALTRKLNNKEQRIVVSGDADFMSNTELAHPRGFNQVFVNELFKWFSYGAFPLDISRPAMTDDSLLLNRKQIAGLKLLFLDIVPGLLIALGAFILIRRKRN
ncbi:ABC-2 type transport system permease protein [Chitinophaga sp. CF118]|uniref:Gldg family protein n=1 Tax=Chitinophaga sp. CF118 TaxID=1884367 RepID=UPI0008EBEF33|nr:Gldg family protein [Chitinophaga sp. CF118]SFE35233.1 ABC-2 type transport system permease protein [Chitinophaga sp. CF118]